MPKTQNITNELLLKIEEAKINGKKNLDFYLVEPIRWIRFSILTLALLAFFILISFEPEIPFALRVTFVVICTVLHLAPMFLRLSWFGVPISHAIPIVIELQTLGYSLAPIIDNDRIIGYIISWES